jgi:hypothetical protein
MGVARQSELQVFFCYSHEDRDLRDQLERHLAPLKRTGQISAWHDRAITAGTSWADEIGERLERADLILLLVSADFLSSDYCYDVELQRAMERHASGTARVIPVLLRAVVWEDTPFSALQAVPTNGKPVTSWANRDEAFVDVARAIRTVVLDLAGKRSAEPIAPQLRGPRAYEPIRSAPLPDEHSGALVGRADVRQAFDRFVSTHPRGYFVLEAAPGYGKTAVAAWLVNERHLVHHFITATERRSDPRLMLISLLDQLEAPGRTDLRSLPLDQLAAAFERALATRASTAPVIVVIDALNELEGNDSPFLPTDHLPPHVYFFLTSQPDARLDAWKLHLASVPHTFYRMGPLGAPDVREMIRRRLPDAPEHLIASITSASEGSPLYVGAAVDACAREPGFDSQAVPSALEGYFRRAMSKVPDGDVLHDVVGLIAVSRHALSLSDLSELAAVPQRRVYHEGILPIKQFLTESGYHYAFYHRRFHDFILREVLYGDEVRRYHARMADWLGQPAAKASEYRWSSLAYHLFNAGAHQRLVEEIDETFLSQKLRRSGYSVLEDIELVAHSLLEADDPAVVELCVNLVEGLRALIGAQGVDDIARRVQPNRLHATAWAAAAVEPSITSIPGVDVHAVMLPKGAVTADFIEVIPLPDRVVLAIGDAPSTGLKSAFTARFIASVFRRLVATVRPLHLGRVLEELNRTISRSTFFDRVSMQCIEVVPAEGGLAIASAGHPYPILYSARRGRCDILPVRGPRLHELPLGDDRAAHYDERHAEIGQGDIVVMASDGLTEGGRLDGSAYGYRFAAVIEQHAATDARSLCHAVLQDWRAHPRDPRTIDDMAVLIVKMKSAAAGAARDDGR